jgi:hypothetical protein
VAISPDVVSFVHDSFGYCDLRWGSGIGNVAREASSISLATGHGSQGSLLHRSREMMEAPGPSTRSGGGFYFYAFSAAGFIGAVQLGRV